MFSERATLTFVRRCFDCPAVYDGKTVLLLLDDGTQKACTCGGRLVEDVGPVPERDGRSAPMPEVPHPRPPVARGLSSVPRIR